MRLSDIGERRLIACIRRTFAARRPDVLMGIGDDAAVVRGPRRLLLTTDVLVEDEDFRRSLHPPRLLGRKALNVNLSDIAAMGGRPLHALVGLVLPGATEEAWLEAFMAGMRSAAREAGVALVGGDLSRGDRIVVAVTVTGRAEAPVLRRGARPGHAVYVSGTLGDAAQGFRLLEEGQSPSSRGTAARLIRRFLDPTPRLELGRTLAERRLASSMIDLSDGLSVDLAHVCEESGVGTEIWGAAIPLSQALRRWAMNPLAAALDGGEDFELLFTVPPTKTAAVESLRRRFALTRIGTITAGRGIVLVTAEGKRTPLAPGGFEHFR